MTRRRRPAVGRAVVLPVALLALALGGCGSSDDDGGGPGSGAPGSGASGSGGEELDGSQLRAAIEEDRTTADAATREVAPLLADTLGGRVLAATAGVEGCNGGSFEGSTAYGYQVSGRIVGFRAGADELLPTAEKVARALAGAGWADTDARDTAPGKAGAEGSKDGVVLGVNLDENLSGALFTVRGRCLPVTDDGRDAVVDIEVPTYVIERR